MNETTLKIILECVGYLGSLLVLISMLMTSVVKLRIINMIGNAVCTAYAIVTNTWPIAALNACLFVINVYHLIRLFRVKKQYEQVKTDLRDGYLSYLFDKNIDDIHTFFPTFSRTAAEPTVTRLVLCGKDPAGLFLAKETGEDQKDLEIILDYALPAYRDASVGRYLYKQLAAEGYRSLIFNVEASGHDAFMKKMGYKKREGGGHTLDLSRFK